MLRYECDNCHRFKNNDEAWILGFAAERIGAVSARREITIASSWDEDRAVNLLAVHFCSDECRAEYMQAMFGDDSAPVIRELELVPQKERVVTKLPAKRSTVVEKKKRTAKRRRSA
jgi:hypothetical protein